MIRRVLSAKSAFLTRSATRASSRTSGSATNRASSASVACGTHSVRPATARAGSVTNNRFSVWSLGQRRRRLPRPRAPCSASGTRSARRARAMSGCVTRRHLSVSSACGTHSARRGTVRGGCATRIPLSVLDVCLTRTVKHPRVRDGSVIKKRFSAKIAMRLWRRRREDHTAEHEQRQPLRRHHLSAPTGQLRRGRTGQRLQQRDRRRAVLCV